jgi:hypothetical protein
MLCKYDNKLSYLQTIITKCIEKFYNNKITSGQLPKIYFDKLQN